jgi:hypothetical protein
VCKAGLVRGQACLPKKRALELFPYESKGLVLLCALAHNFVHKKCEEAGWAVRKLRAGYAAKFFIAKISSSKINGLP